MKRRKIFRRGLNVLIGVIITLNASIACAEVYDGAGVYFMTDETVEFAKNKAELEAQRDVLEKICVYVKSISTVINNQLENDEIITISAGILHVIDTKFSMEQEDGLIEVKSFVTAQIDIDELKKLLERAIKERVSDD